MSIFQDIRKGDLDETAIKQYIRNDSQILNTQESDSGLTPLALAIGEGLPEVVRNLLQNGARADGLTRNYATPLLIAAWKTKKEQNLIIQILLDDPRSLSIIDTTCSAAKNKTPLMWCIDREKLESVRMLRRKGASLTIKNSEGRTAKQMAEGREDIYRALYPNEEPTWLSILSGVVVSFLTYIIAWVNFFLNGGQRRVAEMNPLLNSSIDRVRRHRVILKTQS